jgi:hypothetical protein
VPEPTVQQALAVLRGAAHTRKARDLVGMLEEELQAGRGPEKASRGGSFPPSKGDKGAKGEAQPPFGRGAKAGATAQKGSRY